MCYLANIQGSKFKGKKISLNFCWDSLRCATRGYNLENRQLPAAEPFSAEWDERFGWKIEKKNPA